MVANINQLHNSFKGNLRLDFSSKTHCFEIFNG